VPPVRNPNAIMGPQVSRGERTTSRADELRRNTPPQNIVKETTPQQAAPVRSSILSERKIDAPERKIEVQGKTPAISVNEQPVRANIIEYQTPKPSDNARSISPIQSNSPAIASQTQPQKNEDKSVARVMKPQETHAVRGPVTLNNARENIPPRNIIKETTSQQAAPVRAVIVPEKKIEAPEKKIEVLKNNLEGPANEQRGKAETQQQQNPKPIENVKIAPLVRSNSPATLSQQQQQPPENTDKTQATPKGEQITPQKVSIENIKPEDKIKDLKKEARTEMQERKR
jgi:hypothetical protein